MKVHQYCCEQMVFRVVSLAANAYESIPKIPGTYKYFFHFMLFELGVFDLLWSHIIGHPNRMFHMYLAGPIAA